MDVPYLTLVVLDVHLALRFRSAYPRTCTVFVGPRTLGEIGQRLASRGDVDAHVAQRLELVKEELSLRHLFDLDCDGSTSPEKIADAAARHLKETHVMDNKTIDDARGIARRFALRHSSRVMVGVSLL